jgi:hypothetical protein
MLAGDCFVALAMTAVCHFAALAMTNIIDDITVKSSYTKSIGPFLFFCIIYRTTETRHMDRNFLIRADELDLTFSHGAGHRQLAFQYWKGTPEAWKSACREQLLSLLGLELPALSGIVREVRQLVEAGVTIQALIMQVDDQLSIPAYFLVPSVPKDPSRVVMAIHGHGEVDMCIGLGQWDDYHHSFALALAQAGY